MPQPLDCADELVFLGPPRITITTTPPRDNPEETRDDR